MNTKENKNTLIAFRTSEEFKKKLEAMAAKENRSLSNLIEMILDKAVKGSK
ncbi:MAG: hypothetical protein QM737_10975 [Ferruginibacter sp.]